MATVSDQPMGTITVERESRAGAAPGRASVQPGPGGGGLAEQGNERARRTHYAIIMVALSSDRETDKNRVGRP